MRLRFLIIVPGVIYFFITDALGKKASVFVTCKHFQLSLIFSSQAKRLHSKGKTLHYTKTSDQHEKFCSGQNYLACLPMALVTQRKVLKLCTCFSETKYDIRVVPILLNKWHLLQFTKIIQKRLLNASERQSMILEWYQYF